MAPQSREILACLLFSLQATSHCCTTRCVTADAYPALAISSRLLQLISQHCIAGVRYWAQCYALVCSQRVPGVFAVACEAGSRYQQPQLRGQHPTACSSRQWSRRHCSIPVGPTQHDMCVTFKYLLLMYQHVHWMSERQSNKIATLLPLHSHCICLRHLILLAITSKLHGE